MSPLMLFLILLVVGGLFIFCSSKLDGKGQAFFLILGGIFALIGGYGIFTALC